MLRSAGVVLLHVPSNQILLVCHKSGHWGFPKGTIEMGEDPKSAAIRELEEETGAKPRLLVESEFASEHYRVSDSAGDSEKVVHYFIGITFDADLEVNKLELLDARWLTIEEIDRLPEFLSKGVLEKLRQTLNSGGIKLHISPGKGAATVSVTDMQKSKHAYSRISPLCIINPNLTVSEKPGTIDSSVIDTVIRLAVGTEGEVTIPRHHSASSRSVIALIPGIVCRNGRVTFHHPQGCNIGERKIDLYLDIIQQFGAEVRLDGDAVTIEKKTLHPAQIDLPFPSFTGTSIALTLASQVNGSSIINNISIEPEIFELITVLNKTGSKVTFQAERRVEVRGGVFDRALTVSLSEDRNVLVTKICAALIQENEFSYSSDNVLYLSPLAAVFERMGVNFEFTPHSFILKKNTLHDLRPVDIIAGHYPAFCSDWQPLIAPILCKISGTSSIHDTVFENRYEYIVEVNRINPRFNHQVAGDKLVITGNTSPREDTERVTVRCLDIRSGASNIIAALGEQKTVTLLNTHQLFRGYEDIVAELSDMSDGRLTYTI
jgi:UDP-N-acetylglucosamine enolpyruvyl transferase/8-oxo-dGTP pyrophosphatase MutT (NUDIX family)